MVHFWVFVQYFCISKTCFKTEIYFSQLYYDIDTFICHGNDKKWLEGLRLISSSVLLLLGRGWEPEDVGQEDKEQEEGQAHGRIHPERKLYGQVKDILEQEQDQDTCSLIAISVDEVALYRSLAQLEVLVVVWRINCRSKSRSRSRIPAPRSLFQQTGRSPAAPWHPLQQHPAFHWPRWRPW